MLLQKLREYSERLDLPPTLYSELAVRYVIDLDSEGRYLGLIDTADPSTPRTRRGRLRLVPEVRRTSAPKALMLCDKADYVLEYNVNASRPDRIAEAHRLFLDLTRRCAQATEEPAVLAVLTFLEANPLDQLALPADFSPGDRITFRVDGLFPVDLHSVQAFWAAENSADEAKATRMQCLVCGGTKPVLARLQGTLKGIPGGQTSGTSIISANAEAFESYGLEASLIAPTCADCGERFTKAANALLGSVESRSVLAGSAFIYWTREPVLFDFLGPLTNPPQDFQTLLDSLWRGGSRAGVDAVHLYATVLSGSGGRAVVRDWIDTTVGEAKEKLAQWFRRQAIVGAYAEAPRPLGLAALAGGTVRQLSDVARPTTRSLLHAALTGTPLPKDLLFQAVRRNRAEQAVTRQRAALIKLVLCSQPENNDCEDKMSELDLESKNPAYRCGRLLAVLERAQQRAIPGVNATIVDRFFGTASSAPASVFPRLVRGAQPHLAKLERDRRGTYVVLQRNIDEIMGGLPLQHVEGRDHAYPRTLTLDQQGVFALGYYHQRATLNQRRSDSPGSAAPTANDDPSNDYDDSPEESITLNRQRAISQE